MRLTSRRTLIVLTATFAASALATASASAYTNPILVNSKGKDVSKVSFTGESVSGNQPAPIRTPGGAIWSCNKETGTGELSTTGTGGAATTSGTATVIFTDCNFGGGAGANCSNTKTMGEIESKVSLSLVWLGKESEEVPGLRSSIAPVSEDPGNGKGTKLKWACGIYKFEVENAFVASLSSPLNEVFTEAVFEPRGIDGKQSVKAYTYEGKEAKTFLYSSLGGSTFEESATEFVEEQTYKEAVKIVKS